jgi:hypothetical protein
MKMKRLIELLTEFPTVIFTAVLAFCLAWWIVSIVVSGADGDFDADLDADVDHPLHLGHLPLSLACTILVTFAWALSLLGQIALDAFVLTGVILVAGSIALAVASVAFGLKMLGILAKPAARIFVSEPAPHRHASVGASCRIRTTHVTDSFGDAEVLDGPTKGSLVKVRSNGHEFARGDVALIIEFDERSEAFAIVEHDPHLTP